MAKGNTTSNTTVTTGTLTGLNPTITIDDDLYFHDLTNLKLI